jgi:hypothetical protein
MKSVWEISLVLSGRNSCFEIEFLLNI